jgi:hypothetical protein
MPKAEPLSLDERDRELLGAGSWIAAPDDARTRRLVRMRLAVCDGGRLVGGLYSWKTTDKGRLALAWHGRATAVPP